MSRTPRSPVTPESPTRPMRPLPDPGDPEPTYSRDDDDPTQSPTRRMAALPDPDHHTLPVRSIDSDTDPTIRMRPLLDPYDRDDADSTQHMAALPDPDEVEDI